jgi:hypothetical protein
LELGSEKMKADMRQDLWLWMLKQLKQLNRLSSIIHGLADDTGPLEESFCGRTIAHPARDERCCIRNRSLSAKYALSAP